MPKGKETYGAFIADSQERLREELSRRGVPDDRVAAALASGYSFLEAIPPTRGPLLRFPDGHYLKAIQGEVPAAAPCVADGFYGSKWFIGLIPIELFAEYAATGRYPFRTSTPTLKVRSLKEAEAILARKGHREWRERGLMSFRGQTSQHRTRRELPNPFRADDEGRELLILPSFWRSYREDWDARPLSTPPSVFSTLFADELIYRGIPGWRTLPLRNLRRYGLHSMSDLEDFPDPQSREYGRRWRKHKVEGFANPELPLLEQHYGIPTAGLDLTFSLETALFFATHKFTPNPDGTASFRPIERGRHQGVVYCLVLRDPPLVQSVEMWTRLEIFAHVPPLRPLRQKCALPGFDAFDMNAAAADLHVILELDPEFDMEGLPAAEDIFPSADADPFYGALLEMKRKHPKVFGDIVEYAHP